MAERIQKVRECDSGGCRRRKGVQSYMFTVTDERNEAIDCPDGYQSGAFKVFVQGELCPYHYELNMKRLRNSVANTKEY